MSLFEPRDRVRVCAFDYQAAIYKQRSLTKEKPKECILSRKSTKHP